MKTLTDLKKQATQHTIHLREASAYIDGKKKGRIRDAADFLEKIGLGQFDDIFNGKEVK